MISSILRIASKTQRYYRETLLDGTAKRTLDWARQKKLGESKLIRLKKDLASAAIIILLLLADWAINIILLLTISILIFIPILFEFIL